MHAQVEFAHWLQTIGMQALGANRGQLQCQPIKSKDKNQLCSPKESHPALEAQRHLGGAELLVLQWELFLSKGGC